MLRSAGGAAQPNLSPKKLLTVEIPIPSLDEQRRIAAILDKADGLEKQSAVCHRMREQLIASTFIEMFGDPVENQKDWQTCMISDLTSMKVTKGSTPTTYGYKWEDEGVLFLRSECVLKGEINLQGSMRISDDAHQHMSRSQIIPGDIVLRITGDVGTCSIFPKDMIEANTNQHNAIIRLKDDAPVVRKFLEYQLNSMAFIRYFRGMCRGVTHPHLSLTQVRDAVVVIPPISLQEEFVQIIEIIEEIPNFNKLAMLNTKSLTQELIARS